MRDAVRVRVSDPEREKVLCIHGSWYVQVTTIPFMCGNGVFATNLFIAKAHCAYDSPDSTYVAGVSLYQSTRISNVRTYQHAPPPHPSQVIIERIAAIFRLIFPPRGGRLVRSFLYIQCVHVQALILLYCILFVKITTRV